jgi:hypothetical protein
MQILRATRAVPVLMLAAALVVGSQSLLAQGRDARRQALPPDPSHDPNMDWPVDLTGQWVAAVTEDWNYRMKTPAKGDYTGVPLNAEGRKVADAWDPAKDEAAGNQCKAYGAPAIMRVPGRIRISWADAGVMKIETDSGKQTRLLYFQDPNSLGGDLQGVSRAVWDVKGRRGPVRGGLLTVVTTKLKPGYLRKNGVPYSDKTELTEYYTRTDNPNGDSWLVIMTVVNDPTYLTEPYTTTSQFKKQDDESGWNPTPCSAR